MAGEPRDEGNRKRAGLAVGIIADDLTGAMDAAAPFAKRGLATWAVVSPEAIARQAVALAGSADVVSVNTETRHAAPVRARTDTTRAVQTLARLHPAIVFKKIDSTMRGHVAEETVAALCASGRSQAVLTPAVPAQGRTLKHGCVLVHGRPLKDTTIGRDLRAPPPSEPVPDLLRQADPGLEVCSIATGGKLPPAGAGLRRVLVADCEAQSDLDALAQQLKENCGDTLIVGAAGLAEALAEWAFGPALPPSPRVGGTAGVSAYVVGSRSRESARQAERLIAALPKALVLELADGEEEATTAAGLERLAAETSGVVVIRPKASKGVDSLDADRVARALADSVAQLVERAPVTLLAMTGGDTALAVLRRLGVETIEVAGEVRPGVVFGRVALHERQLWVLTKAGGFGDDELFLDIERFFQEFERKK